MIEVSDHQTAVPAPRGLLGLARRAAAAALASVGEARGATISVAFVDDAAIRELNRTYRGEDAATDVLSFPLGDPPEPGGEVVVSLEAAARQAAEAGHPFRAEVAFLVVHGVLHLLGYDHHTAEAARAMRAVEARVLAGLGLPFPADLEAGGR